MSIKKILFPIIVIIIIVAAFWLYLQKSNYFKLAFLKNNYFNLAQNRVSEVSIQSVRDPSFKILVTQPSEIQKYSIDIIISKSS